MAPKDAPDLKNKALRLQNSTPKSCTTLILRFKFDIEKLHLALDSPQSVSMFSSACTETTSEAVWAKPIWISENV